MFKKFSIAAVSVLTAAFLGVSAVSLVKAQSEDVLLCVPSQGYAQKEELKAPPPGLAPSDFSDSVLKDYIFENYDADGDNYISSDERMSVTEVTIKSNLMLQSLEDLTYFDNLEVVEISNCTNLTKVDVSGCSKLRSFTCKNCSISSFQTVNLSSNSSLVAIDVSGCINLTTLVLPTTKTNLEQLDVIGTSITSLELDAYENLKILRCSDSDVSYLTVPVSIEEIYASSISITGIDVTNCPDLRVLSVPYCKINHIYVNYNSKLEELNLASNPLSALMYSIEVDACENLVSIDLSDTGLSFVDLSTNQNLRFIYLSGCPMKTLCLPDTSKGPNTVLQVLHVGGTKIEELDVSQYQVLTDLYCMENYALEHLTLYSNDIENNTLELLWCHETAILGTLNLSNLKALKYVRAYDTSLTKIMGNSMPNLVSVNLSNQIALQTIEFFDTGLEYFYADDCPELTTLEVSKSKIKSLSVYNNPKLERLYCYNNELTSLDLSNNSNLRGVMCSNNNISTLTLSSSAPLEMLYCDNNCLTSLSLNSYPDLDILYCFDNNLASLDVTMNTKLEYLDCSGNAITVLQVHPLEKLLSLNCEMNDISVLDVTSNPLLEELYCGENKISSIDLSKNPALRVFSAYANELTALDVSANANLEKLSLSGNQIGKLDVSKNAKLEDLLVANCQLTELNVNGATALCEISCSYNKLTSLDLSQNPNLRILFVEDNSIPELVIEGCPMLVDLVTNFPPADDGHGHYFCEDNVHVYILRYDQTTTLLLKKPEPPTPEPDPPTPVPVPDPTFEDFVERLYTVALGRPSEPEGKAFWVDQVVNKGFTGADCARFFMLGAPEFLGRNLTDDEFVEVLYKTYFDRASEPEGKAYWMGRLASGTERAVLVDEFIESVEWCNVCATYGVKSGALYHKATIPSKNAVKFATRLYTCCLGREPEEDGLNYWALALTNLDVSGYQAASLFFTLPEFVGLKTTNEEYLTRLYTTFMGRDPEAEGFAYWLGLLNGGTDRVDVMKAFAACPEFQEICNQYGIVRGEI